MHDSIALSPTQLQVQSAIRDYCVEFDEEYWREKDRENEYPHKFVKMLAEKGWPGILVPEEYGGKGYGTEEAVVMMNEIAASGAGFSGAQTIHAAIYNSAPLIWYASEK